MAWTRGPLRLCNNYNRELWAAILDWIYTRLSLPSLAVSSQASPSIARSSSLRAPFLRVHGNISSPRLLRGNEGRHFSLHCSCSLISYEPDRGGPREREGGLRSPTLMIDIPQLRRILAMWRQVLSRFDHDCEFYLNDMRATGKRHEGLVWADIKYCRDNFGQRSGLDY